MTKRTRTYSTATTEATKLLGSQIAVARRERRWTLQELAERVGVTHVTMRKIEHGDPSVGLGVAFEAATLTGVALFHADRSRRAIEAARIEDRLTALPDRVRKPTKIDDDF